MDHIILTTEGGMMNIFDMKDWLKSYTGIVLLKYQRTVKSGRWSSHSILAFTLITFISLFCALKIKRAVFVRSTMGRKFDTND